MNCIDLERGPFFPASSAQPVPSPQPVESLSLPFHSVWPSLAEFSFIGGFKCHAKLGLMEHVSLGDLSGKQNAGCWILWPYLGSGSGGVGDMRGILSPL